MSKPILCLDFDGTIHSYTSGWQGPTNIPDPPVEGALVFIRNASRYMNIHIFSSRSTMPGGIGAMKGWLFEWGKKQLGLYAMPIWMKAITWDITKPPARVILDDRAITFTGVWPDPRELAEFEPWWKNKEVV